MFKIGDRVRFVGDYKKHMQEPSPLTGLTLEGLCRKHNNIFTIEHVYTSSKKYTILEDSIWTFKEDELESYLNVDAIDAIIYGITSQMQDEKGPSIEYPREIINKEIPNWSKSTSPKEEDIMKILEIYEEKQTKLIEHKYDKQLEELEKNDRLRVYFEQVKETVKEILELKENEICEVNVCMPMSLTKETINKRDEILKIMREEKAELINKIKEIQALLELAPNYEEKIQILRDYGIIDKKKNIIL